VNTRRKLNRLESHEQKRHKNPRSGQSENCKLCSDVQIDKR
jgi:hypothetical protein